MDEGLLDVVFDLVVDVVFDVGFDVTFDVAWSPDGGRVVGCVRVWRTLEGERRLVASQLTLARVVVNFGRLGGVFRCPQC